MKTGTKTMITIALLMSSTIGLVVYRIVVYPLPYSASSEWVMGLFLILVCLIVLFITWINWYDNHHR